ncbi:MAG: Linoleoyl-CoA desaturase, partial [uncultured Propionibacteriaceae bacterium]
GAAPVVRDRDAVPQPRRPRSAGPVRLPARCQHPYPL